MELLNVCILVSLFNISTAVSLFNSSCLNCACCINNECHQNFNKLWCTHGCQAGHYGAECGHDCSTFCATCSRSYGECLECHTGYQNKYTNCENLCPTNCIKCWSISVCEGPCKDGYYSGYFLDKQTANRYDDCRYKCRDKCLRCDSYYNDCKQCKTGFSGRSCEYCSAAYYGEECNFKCDNCKGGECARTDGVCTRDCNSGYKGDTCIEVEKYIIAISLLSVVLGIVLGAVSVLGVRKLVRRRRRIRASNQNTDTEENNDQQVDGKSRDQINLETSMKKSIVYADNTTYIDYDETAIDGS